MKKIKPILLGILLSGTMLFAFGCGEEVQSGTEKEKEKMYQQISMEEAKELMETEEDYVILDVRTEEEFSKGHIPGAVCIPNETIGTDAIPELPDKEQLILIYCRSGNRSKQAAEKLAAQGYTHIQEFGGILDWDGEIEPGNL